jgi:hypothetical protein
MGDEIEGPPGGVSLEVAAQLKPNRGSVFMKIAFLDLENFDAILDKGFGAGNAGLEILGVRNILEAELEKFEFRIAECAATNLVYV